MEAVDIIAPFHDLLANAPAFAQRAYPSDELSRVRAVGPEQAEPLPCLGFRRRLAGLAVDAGGARLAVSTDGLPPVSVEVVEDPLQDPIVPPRRNVVVHGIPLRQVVWEQSRGVSRAQYVPDTVDDLAPLVFRRRADALRLRNQLRNQRILEVAQVTGAS